MMANVLFKKIIVECIQSYGDNCRHQCTHCINHECDRFNGSCLYGCKEEKTCKPGIFNNPRLGPRINSFRTFCKTLE